jgi:hypothetical protein
MYKEIIIPNDQNHTIEIPKELYGKKIEVVINEISNSTDRAMAAPILPDQIKDKSFWNNLPYVPDFPSQEEIRKQAWPNR